MPEEQHVGQGLHRNLDPAESHSQGCQLQFLLSTGHSMQGAQHRLFWRQCV